jgi:hypothetical protein
MVKEVLRPRGIQRPLKKSVMMSRVGRIVVELEYRFHTQEQIREVLEVSAVQESLPLAPSYTLGDASENPTRLNVGFLLTLF